MRFTRASRILKPAEYDAVKLEGARAYGRLLLISYLVRAAIQPVDSETSNTKLKGRGSQSRRYSMGPRLGIAVTKKVAPRAVDRNRFKRSIREAFRALMSNLELRGIKTIDIVVVARRDIATARPGEIPNEFRAILRREGLLIS